MKITPRVSPFLAWVDFHARSRFARSTIPEGKWGTTRSLAVVRRKRLHSPFTIVQFRITKINTWLPFLGFLFFTLSLGASMNFYTSELAAY